MNRRNLVQKIALSALGVEVTALLPSCTITGRSEVSSTGSLPPTTKDAPFVNSLGMKFVPVPGTNFMICTTETTVAQYRAGGMVYRQPESDVARGL